MAYVFKSSYSPTTGADAIAQLVKLLTDATNGNPAGAGWTVPAWGKGTDAAGVSLGMGANGTIPNATDLANYGAYVILRQPAGGNAPYSGIREWCLQRDAISPWRAAGSTVNRDWYIAFSESGGFSTAAGILGHRIPLAADRRFFGGTYAAVDGSNPHGYPQSPMQLFQNDATYRITAIAMAGEPFQWILTSFPGANGGVVTRLGQDAVTNFSTGDPQPYVYLCRYDSGGGIFNVSDLNGWAGVTDGYLKKGLIGEGFVRLGLMTMNNNWGQVFPEGISTDHMTGKDILIPACWARHSGQANPVGWKGQSSLFYWASPDRALGDTLNVQGGTKNYIRLNEVALPWDGTDPLL